MRLTLKLLMVVVLIGCFNFSFAQRAKDGNQSITTANNIVNTYTYLTANATAGTFNISVNNSAMTGGVFGGSLAPGDLILIIQMQGATMNNDGAFCPNYSVPNGFTWFNNWFDHAEMWGSIGSDFGANGWGSYNNSGKFEQAEVAAVPNGSTITLQCGLKNTYTAAGHVQIVRIPRFDNLSVSGGLNRIVPPLWNGQTGGVVAIEVDQNLDIASGSSISASGFGFRGGTVDGTGKTGGTSPALQVRYLGTPDPAEGSEKGEGIFGFTTEYNAICSRYGIAAPANGGGGGGYQNAGGGGGSNIYTGALPYRGTGVPDQNGGAYTAAWNIDISLPPYPNPDILNPGSAHLNFLPIGTTQSPGGGRGGYALSDVTSPPSPLTTGPDNAAWAGDSRKTNGGLGGHPLAYDPTRIFFGGGGGAGDQDSNQGGSGGRGGGIVFVTCYGTITGSGTIEANGAAGQNSNPNNLPVGSYPAKRGNDGAGGGGAGGSVYIQNATALPASINLTALGGNGGNMNLTLSSFSSFYAPDEAGGPGGSGAGGAIAFNSGAPTQNVTAGLNGVVNSNDPTPMMALFPPNGATRGFLGVSNLTAPYYDLVGTNDTICGSGSGTLSVSVLGSLPAGSTIQWYNQQFGGASLGSGTTFNTPVVAVTTTYWVGICPGNGTFRIPVTIVVQSAPNLVITDPAPVCSPLTVDITAAGVTTGSDPGTLTYWTDNLATNPLANPNAVAASGIYYIQLDAGGGCTTIQPVNVTINPAQDASFTYTANCQGGTTTITGVSGGTFTWNPAPGDAANLNGSTGEITNGTLGTTYFVQYTTPGPCAASSTQSVTVATDLAYTAAILDENCGAGDGQITLNATGGDGGPYQYSITGGAPYVATNVFGTLSAGSYSISILDGTGCEVTGTETVSSTGGPTISTITPTNPTCAGACDGSITITVTGGTAPYSYQWYDALSNPIGTNSNTITGLCAGDYSVEVTDAGGGAANFFTEDFGTGCSQNNSANGTVTVNGTWTVLDVGAADPATSNAFFISATESGMGFGNCGDGCLGTGTTNRTLHIGNEAGTPASGLFCPSGDCGAAYDASVSASIRSVSPVINCSGQTNISLTLDYIHMGSPGSDFGSIWYYDGSTWSAIQTPLPQVNCCDLFGGPDGVCDGFLYAQGRWDQITIALPASADNNPNVQIGIEWENNNDNIGTDPSLAVDNLVLSSSSTGCPAFANTTLTDPAPINLVTTDPAAVCEPNTVDITLPAVTAGSDAGTLTYWLDNTATTTNATPGTISTSGWYYIQLDVLGCTELDSVLVTINPLDDASFSYGAAAYCVNAADPTPTVTGLAGGTFTSSPAGLSINATTGQIDVSASTPNTYTVTYTTAGTCPNSSNVSVTISPLDDASFSYGAAAYCVNAADPTPTITGLAGGTFTSSPAGLSINATTGQIDVSASTPNTYTVTYTTAGACPNASNVSVTISPLDDASFSYGAAAYCVNAADPTPTITGLAGGTFTSSPVGLSINATTGQIDVSASTPNTYTVTYTTAGVCPNSSNTSVTINPLDDASFSYSGLSYCISGADPTPTITGLAGGTFTSSPAGLTINASTGTVDVSTSTPGTYTVTYTTAGACPNSSNVSFTVTALDDATFSYSAATYCVSGADPTPTANTAGGTYSSSPAGLSINASTGQIDVSASTPGAYTVTYTTGGACSNSSNVSVTITALDDATFSYSASAYCVNAVDPTPTANTAGGTYSSSPAGLSINSTTGQIDVSASTPNTYTVTYTTGGACSNSSNVSVTINPLDDATFAYAAAAYCVNGTDPTPTITGLAGGTFTSSPAGLSINASTGQIDVSASTPNTYTVTYTTAGACPNSSNVNVTIDPLDDASFAYGAVAYCINGSDPTPTVTGLAGGTFTSSPAGLSINASTGQIDVSASTPNAYTVTYTTAGTCPNSSNVSVTINDLDDASFSYSGLSYCVSGTDPTPTVTGLTGGTFTSLPAGLSINASTGQIDVSTSTPNTYTVTYTTAGVCPNSSNVSITITALDDATFSYGAAAYCVNAVDPTPTANTAGGTYSSSPVGLSINSSTGQIDVSASTPNTYSITYTTGGACSNTSNVSVTINPLDDATFAYGASAYCVNAADPIPTVTGLAGGTYSSSPAGLSINSTTGQIDVSASTPGAYTVTYTTAGACPNSSNVNVTINSLDDATFAFGASTYCESAVDPTPTITGLSGGTFTSSPAGLSINTSTGQIDVSASTPNTYTVTYTTAGACPNSSNVNVTIDPLDDATFVSSDFCVSSVNTISGVVTSGGTFSIQSQTGSGGVTINASTGVLSNFVAGDQIVILYTTPASGCQNTSTQTVNVTPLDDATFVSSDFCVSSVNTISGVVTAGGTFSIQSQTGSGGVMINASTGVLSNFVAGDQIVILYTTPAGGCQNTYTQTVNVTNLDDASFTSIDFCENSTNAINAVATPGGTFSIQSQTGSGGVTINASTGILSNFVAGDQIVILYTTPAGSCQSTSTQTVNVLPADDATFVSTDFCESSVNTISGVVTSGGTFSIQSQSGSGGVTINGTTGILSNYVAGDQVVIEYTTPVGGCQATYVQTVSVIPNDDASFSYTVSCEGATATISGTTGGTFAFTNAPIDNAVIDPATGNITNATEGGSYTVEYITNGTCSNNSVQTVVIDDCEEDLEVIIPSAFTPDGDNANDTWHILNLDVLYPNSIVRVYNRWGNLVYEHQSSVTNPYNLNAWDGTYQGTLLPVASYFYIVDFNDGVKENAKGTVSIILND